MHLNLADVISIPLFSGCFSLLLLDCLVGWLVGWLAGCLVGWLLGWLVGWLVGWLAALASMVSI